MLGGGGGSFFPRQFGSAVKLLRNLLAWQGLVADHVLRDVALGSLLNRYLIAALRICEPVDAAEKCNMVSGCLLTLRNPHGKESTEVQRTQKIGKEKGNLPKG